MGDGEEGLVGEGEGGVTGEEEAVRTTLKKGKRGGVCRVVR